MQVSKIPKKPEFPQLRGNVASLRYPTLAEVKYDGELNFIHYDDQGSLFTVNKYGTVRENFPALNDVRSAIKNSGHNSATLLAELYWEDGKLGRLYDLLSHKKDDAVKLCIFDCIQWDGISLRDEPLVSRKEAIFELFLQDYIPECMIVENIVDLNAFYFNKVTDGFEGVVVKDLDSRYMSGPCSWVKIKKKDRSDYKVMIIDPVKERIEVVVPVPKKGIIITVGVKAPNRYKKHIKIGDMVTIEHQGVLASGSLRHPVLIPKKEWK